LILALANPEKLLTAVAVPKPAAVLLSERSMKAPGTGCGVAELSKAVIVTVAVAPAVNEPVGAIGFALTWYDATGEKT
jgi:hypothetical protein